MTNLTHPALTYKGVPREHIAVDEWTLVIERLTAQIAAARHPVVRRNLVQQRMDALAAKDAAWIKREAGLCSLLSS